MGNFIRLQSGQIPRIDQIFVHELNHRNRLFCKVTLVQHDTNPVLKLQMHRFVAPQTATIMVGLPALTAERLCMLPANPDADNVGQPMALFVLSSGIGPSLGSPVGEWIADNPNMGFNWVFWIKYEPLKTS
jgi:hypothetical protein